MRMSGADIVLECLKREGVDVFWGYPGGVVLPFYDRLPAHPEVQHVLVRHEQAAAHAADGYARVSGKVGVCLATSGPGATNLVTGITNAMMDSVPMVVITGNVTRTLLGRDGFQEADITGITLPITKHNYLVMHAADLAYTFKEAFYIAKSGRKGPVLIDIPKDVFVEEAEFEYPDTVAIRGYKPTEAKPVDLAQVKHAARIIDAAQKPVILAGHGVIQSEGGTAALRKFAEKAQIPVLTTLLGIGGISEDHVLSYGFMGMHGMYWANMAAVEADVVIGVGMRFDDRAMGRFADFNTKAKIVHIDIDPAEIGKNFVTHAPILGDVAQVLDLLTPEIEQATHGDWLRWIDVVREEHPSLKMPDTTELTPQFVIKEIFEATKGEAIIVTGVGQHQMWAGQHYMFRHPRRWVSSGGLGTMGFEVPAAMGAQAARPDLEVWSIAGDGGFQMTLQELATIVDQRQPIKFAIMNNGYLGMVRQWQELFYRDNLVDVHISQPDFVKLADAYGIRALRIDDKTDVASAIAEARAHDGPFLLDFHVQEAGNVWPMVPAGAALFETVENADEVKV